MHLEKLDPSFEFILWWGKTYCTFVTINRKAVKVFAFASLLLITYGISVGTRVICDDFGPLDSETVSYRDGKAYAKSTIVPFTGVVRDSGCGKECESLLVCPNPKAVLTYLDGRLVKKSKRW